MNNDLTAEKMVIILNNKLEIQDVNELALKEFFVKEKKDVISQSILELSNKLDLDISNILINLKASLDGLYKITTIYNPRIQKKYDVTIVPVKINKCSYYVLLISLQVEDAYKSLKAYLDAIINNLPGAMYWKDREGHYLGCNKHVAHMAGFATPQEILGKTDYDLCWSEFADDWRKIDCEVMEKGETLIREEKVRLASGEVITELTFKTPLRDENGKVVGSIGTSLDITDKKVLEAQLIKAKEVAEAANELKSQFIQNMQHDMRTPTAGLFHIFDQIRMSRTKEAFLELLDLGEKASKELLALCDTLVDFEQIHYGTKPLINEKLCIKELIDRVCNLNLAAIKSKNLNLIVESDENIPEFLKGDDFRLQKVLTNLMGNSIKFTKVGEIKITAKLVSLRKNKVIIEFGIHDTGMGIPEDKIELIFEKFIRLNPSNQGLYKGSGLGLSIVKKCVEELEGEIDVESEVGKGTSFYVTLPFEKAISNRPIRRTPVSDLEFSHSSTDTREEEVFDITSTITIQGESSQKKNEKGPLSVLLIEDNKLALAAAKSALINANCVVTIAENVADSKSALEKDIFDLVVSDIGLPDGTGFDIIEYVKNNPKHKNYETPFIALTAHMGEETKIKASESGFVHLFHKPIHPQRIKTVLDIYLSDKKEEQQPEEATGEEEPILDLELTRQLSGGVEDLAKEVLEMLIKLTPDDLDQLERAIKNKNSKVARELLHKIKGGLLYCGVPRFKRAIAHLHEQVKATEEVSIWEKAFNNVMKEWNNLIKAYEELRNS